MKIEGGITTYSTVGGAKPIIAAATSPSNHTLLIDFCASDHHRRPRAVIRRHVDFIKENLLSMPAFLNPSFQERQQAAASARSAALAKYKARPPLDEAALAERAARQVAREKAEAEKRAAAVRAKEEATRAKEEAAEKKREEAHQAAIAAEAAVKAEREAEMQARAQAQAKKREERMLWTEEDRKAARDARYAARKARQSRR